MFQMFLTIHFPPAKACIHFQTCVLYDQNSKNIKNGNSQAKIPGMLTFKHQYVLYKPASVLKVFKLLFQHVD